MRPVRKADNLHVTIVWKSGKLNVLDPRGPVMELLYPLYPTRATCATILFSLVLIAVMLRRAVLSEGGTMWSSHRARAVESAHERRSCRSLSLSEYPLQAVAYRGGGGSTIPPSKIVPNSTRL